MTFEALYARYLPEVLRCACAYGPRDDAEDVAQETFEKAWRAWSRFDGSNPGGWLQVIARNCCYNRSRAYKRRQEVHPTYELDAYREAQGASYRMDDLLSARADLEALRPILVRLTAIQQDALRRACRGDEIGNHKNALRRARLVVRAQREVSL